MKRTPIKRRLFATLLPALLCAVCLSAIVVQAEDAPSVPSGFLTAREMLARDEVAPFLELRGDAAKGAMLVLHDYEGRALHRLDASPELAYAPCFAGEKELWFLPYDSKDEGYRLTRVPLNGGAAETFAAP